MKLSLSAYSQGDGKDNISLKPLFLITIFYATYLYVIISPETKMRKFSETEIIYIRVAHRCINVTTIILEHVIACYDIEPVTLFQ